MKQYFYLLHLLQPNVVSLQVPLYIEAIDDKDALSKASTLNNITSSQFQLLFTPSIPVALVTSINGPTFDYFFNSLFTGNRVTINLPISLGINLFQYTVSSTTPSPTHSLAALVLIGGNHPTVFSL